MRYRLIERRSDAAGLKSGWFCQDGERRAGGPKLEDVINEVALWGARVVGVAETFVVMAFPSAPLDLGEKEGKADE